MYKIFLENVHNSINAIVKKRYDLVIVDGNRILSDLAILHDSLTLEESSWVSFLGYLVRRVGIDLQVLSTAEKDTTKLRFIAQEMLRIPVDSEISMYKVFKAYTRYVQQYALEVNENDFADYSRDGSLNESISTWSFQYLEQIGENDFIIGYPIKGISQELKRLSYTEKLSEFNISLQIILEALEWHSETVERFLQTRYLSSHADNKLSIQIDSMIGKIRSFVTEIKELFRRYNSGATSDLNEEKVRSILKILPEILIEWRKVLNRYYFLQTLTLPSPSKKEEPKDEGKNE